MDRSVYFYSRLLGFAPVSDVEVGGEAYEQLRGIFPARLRVVRLQLGHEFVELTEYLAPPQTESGRGLGVCTGCHRSGVDFLRSAFRP